MNLLYIMNLRAVKLLCDGGPKRNWSDVGMFKASMRKENWSNSFGFLESSSNVLSEDTLP